VFELHDLIKNVYLTTFQYQTKYLGFLSFDLVHSGR